MGYGDNEAKLKDGKVSYGEYITYLKDLTAEDLDELYENSLVIFGGAQKVINILEDMKGKYDVCAVDEFFQVLLNTNLISSLSGYIGKSLTPIGLKRDDFELFRIVESTLKDIITFQNERFQLFFSPVISNKVRAFPYDGNFKAFMDFLDTYPGIMQDFFRKNPSAFKDILKHKRDETIVPEETSRISDLVFYIFYSKDAAKSLQNFKQIEKNKLMDFRDAAMMYLVDENGEADYFQRPYNTSHLPPVPDEKIEELKVAEAHSFELLHYLKEKAPIVKNEFENYGNLISQKYGLPVMRVYKHKL